MAHTPIAYTYDADTHCPPCTLARWPAYPGQGWPPESARDREGNPVHAIFPWDQWHEEGEPGTYTLACGTCGGIIESCEHGAPEADDGICTEPCCDSGYTLD